MMKRLIKWFLWIFGISAGMILLFRTMSADDGEGVN